MQTENQSINLFNPIWVKSQSQVNLLNIYEGQNTDASRLLNKKEKEIGDINNLIHQEVFEQKQTLFDQEQNRQHHQQILMSNCQNTSNFAHKQKIYQVDQNQYLIKIRASKDHFDTENRVNGHKDENLDQASYQSSPVNNINDHLETKNHANVKNISPNQVQIEHPKYILIQTDELKQKIQLQKRKQIQILHQQQKEKLKKLKEQSKKFLEVKKQKDKQIQHFKKQLQTLKKNKEKQIVKKQKRQLMHQIEHLREKQHRFYKAVVEGDIKIKRQINRKNEELQIQKQKEDEAKRKEQQKTARLKSTFYQQLERQKQMRQEQQRRKVQQLKNFLKRNNSYQQKLKNLQKEIQQQKPKPLKIKSQMQMMSQERRLNAKSLSAVQIYRMGQQYMQQVHENIDQNLIEKSKFLIEKNLNPSRESSRTEYKDYLKESMVKRSMYYSQSGNRLNVNPEIRELKKLIVKEGNSPQKLLKAKLLTERLEQKAIIKPSVRLRADTIAAKLKIIQEFT